MLDKPTLEAPTPETTPTLVEPRQFFRDHGFVDCGWVNGHEVFERNSNDGQVVQRVQVRDDCQTIDISCLLVEQPAAKADTESLPEVPNQLTLSELKGMRKEELQKLAEERKVAYNTDATKAVLVEVLAKHLNLMA